MPTLRQLEEQGRALLEDQKALVLDESRSWSDKRQEWENREADIKAVLDQHKTLKATDGYGASFADLVDVSSGRVASNGALSLHKSVMNSGYGYRPVATPQVSLSLEDERHLFDAAKSMSSFAVDVKNLDSSAVPQATTPEYRLAPIARRIEPTRILSLMPTYTTQSPQVIWFSQSAGASGAATVAEGGTKPTSTLAYQQQTTLVRKVAHIAEVTDETLADFSGFLSVLSTDMTAGLILAENDQLLNGNGTAPNMRGLASTSGLLTRARNTDTNLDAIAGAFDDLRTGTSYAEPDGILMHPTSWGLIRKQKDVNGRYYVQPTVTAGFAQSLWGVPVVLSTAVTVGTAYVGAFASSCVVYVREGIRIETSNQGTTQFTNNTTLMRCEERLALTVPRPTGIVKVTGIS